MFLKNRKKWRSRLRTFSRMVGEYGPRTQKSKFYACLILTLYQTLLGFQDPRKEGFRKHYGKSRKSFKPSFSPFPSMFFYPSKNKFQFLITFILSSANAFFNLEMSKLLYGKGLKYSITCIQTPPKGRNKSGLLQQVVFECRFY